jgi:DNA-binding transcriptional LysR family regulator
VNLTTSGRSTLKKGVAANTISEVEPPKTVLRSAGMTDKDFLRIMPYIELRHFRSVVVLAEELNFGRAAARLYMTQPPLSQQIRLLEEQLGVTLFNRTKRQVQVTEAGRILAREGRRILADSEQAVRETVKASHGELGILRLGSISSADCIVVKTLKAFARCTPNVQFEMQSMSTNAQLEAIHSGRIQAGFFRLPASDPTLTIKPLLREPLIVAVPQGHILAGKKHLSLTALANEQLVLVSRSSDPGLYDSILTGCKASGFNPRIAYETADVYASLRIVAAGLGISILPSLRHFHQPGVVLRQLQTPAPRTEMAVAYSEENSSQLLQQFLEVLQDIAGAVQTEVDADAVEQVAMDQAAFDDLASAESLMTSSPPRAAVLADDRTLASR